MNQLSWLLYFADVSARVGWAFAAVFLVALAVFVSALVAVPISEGEVLEESNRPKWLKVIRWSITALCVSFVLNSVVPSRDTLYAIAASEMGEEVLKSPVGQKTTKALEAWLDRQIAGEQKAAE